MQTPPKRCHLTRLGGSRRTLRSCRDCFVAKAAVSGGLPCWDYCAERREAGATSAARTGTSWNRNAGSSSGGRSLRRLQVVARSAATWAETAYSYTIGIIERWGGSGRATWSCCANGATKKPMIGGREKREMTESSEDFCHFYFGFYDRKQRRRLKSSPLSER